MPIRNLRVMFPDGSYVSRRTSTQYTHAAIGRLDLGLMREDTPRRTRIAALADWTYNSKPYWPCLPGDSAEYVLKVAQEREAFRLQFPKFDLYHRAVCEQSLALINTMGTGSSGPWRVLAWAQNLTHAMRLSSAAEYKYYAAIKIVEIVVAHD